MKFRPKSPYRAASLCAAGFAFISTAAVHALPTAVGQPLQPAFLDASINRQASGEPIMVLHGEQGDIFVPAETIKAWRLKLSAPRVIEFEGRSYVSITGVPGLTTKLVQETQSLEVTAAPNLLEATVLAGGQEDLGPMTQSGVGAFLNYDLLGQLSDDTVVSGAFELGAFSPWGFATSTFLAGLGNARNLLTRLDTSWTFDDPSSMRSVRVGDSVSRGGIGVAPVRFGGCQFGSNFAVRPGFVTIPLPTIDGSASLPSVIDVYVDNSLRESREVAPGPFSVADVPIVTGSGDVQLIVRDVLGRETVISRPYYATPQLLRQGLHDYSYEVGFLRHHYGTRSHDYGAMMVSGTHRYGVTDRFTTEFQFQGTRHIQAGSVSGIYLLDEVGVIEGSVAGSASEDGIGHLVGLGFERRASSFSFGARAEFTTEEYTNLGSARGKEHPKKTFQLFAGIPTYFGSMGAAYLLRDSRDGPDTDILSANASFRIGRLGSVHIAARKSFAAGRDLALELFYTLPLNFRTSASSGIRRSLGNTSATIDVQRSLPVGEGFGYRVSAATGEVERLNAVANLNTATGRYEAEVASINRQAGVRVGASGAVGAVAGHVFAARKLEQSFAIVRVGEFKDVKVFAENQLVGKTNKKGIAIIPRLRPFERNRIRIELADLPMDTIVTGGEKLVRPYNRSGVTVDFDVKALGRLFSTW